MFSIENAQLFNSINIDLSTLTWLNGVDLGPVWLYEVFRRNALNPTFEERETMTLSQIIEGANQICKWIHAHTNEKNCPNDPGLKLL